MANTTISPNVAAAALTGAAALNSPSTGFLYVTEFESIVDDSRSGTALPRMPPLAVQQLAFNANVSARSLPLNARTRVVRLSSTANCNFRVASSAVATNSDARMVANLAPEFYAVRASESVAAIGSA